MTRTLELDTLVLDEGSHSSPDEGMCVMEAVAFVAGEPFSDHPACASPTIGAFLRSWNDALDDDARQELKSYIPRLVGSASTKKVEQRRAWLATDYLVRTCAPAFLDLVPALRAHAEALTQLPPRLIDEMLAVAS